MLKSPYKIARQNYKKNEIDSVLWRFLFCIIDGKSFLYM